MEEILSKEIQQGLDDARLTGLNSSSRLRIEVNGVPHRVLRMWKTGFAINAAQAPKLRGLVDIHDGTRHLFQCLVVAGQEEDGEMRYEFKRATPVADAAALDFEKPEEPASQNAGRQWFWRKMGFTPPYRFGAIAGR